MNPSGNVSITSCILEHEHGVSELWIRCVEEQHFTVYEPIRLESLSGSAHRDLYPQAIGDAIELAQWGMANPAVFTEGRTSPLDRLNN